MSALYRAVAVLVLVLGSHAPAWGQGGASAMLTDWELFGKKGCAACHHVRGIGDGNSGPDLGRLRSGTGFLDIAAALWNHAPKRRVAMTAQSAEWPQLTPQELSNLISFLFTAQEREAPGNAATGARVFASKGCAQCHGRQGRPGARPFDELEQPLSPALMVGAMWNHGSQMSSALEAVRIGRSILAGSEVSDILAYIRAAVHDPQGERAPIVVGIAERGKQVFADKGCARCHAIGSEGVQSVPKLRPSPGRSTMAQLAGRMWDHGRAVRPQAVAADHPLPRLTRQDSADIVAFLHTSRYFDAAAGDWRRGRELLQEKGCLRCHSINRKGGAGAPDLAATNVVSTQTGQLAAMWNHGRYMGTKARRDTVTLPTLTGPELADITRYLAGLGSVVPTPR